jgi:hypothetical protein
MKPAAWLFLVALGWTALPRTVAYAQVPQPSEQARAEARDRFDRGLRLFNDGDNAGALAEFKRAHEITGNLVTLYNMGLVYAKLGRAVEATDALDRVLAQPDSVPPESLQYARVTRNAQAAQVAQVAIDVSVEGSLIEVDGVEVARTPLAAPLRVTGGSHVVGIIASGFLPSRKEITIAGGETQSFKPDLVPMPGRLAHLAVKTHLPGAGLYVDGQRLASTPVVASIALAPGRHAVELRRYGYQTAATQVVLDEGAMGEVTLEPEGDPAALAADGAMLALDVSETQAVVSIDGRSQGAYVSPLRLVTGLHALTVERGDFEPFARDVAVESGRTTTVRVPLEPTPDYRARYVAQASARRTLAIVTMIGGAVVAGGGVGLLVYDAGQRSDGSSIRERLLAQTAMGQACHMGQDNTAYQAACADPVNAATAKVNDANSHDGYIGWPAVGVGAAAVGLGVVLLVTGDSPSKYDAPRRGQGNVSRVVPVLSPLPGGGMLGVTGLF